MMSEKKSSVIKKTKSEINRKLLSFCHGLFKTDLKNGIVMHPLCYEVPSEKLLLYKFPDNIDDIIETHQIEFSTLTELGWIEPDIEGCYFTVWLSESKAQLCTIDIQTLKISKPSKGLNKDLPFLYSLHIRNKAELPYLVIVEDILHALIFNALGVDCIATGSSSPTKAQIGQMAKLGVPLVFVANVTKKGEQACELFIRHLSRYVSTSVCMVENWGDVFKSENCKNELEQASIDGIDFLVKRILSKHNGKNEYARSLEIMEAASDVGQINANRLIGIAKKEGAIELAHFSAALHLMGDLLQAGITVESARQTVQSRYGVSIFLRQTHNAKLS